MDALPKFLGREISTAIVEATEAIPSDCEIVTFKAGENMPITCAFVAMGDDLGIIPEYAWDGTKWNEIGQL
jgi:hypothetical protein